MSAPADAGRPTVRLESKPMKLVTVLIATAAAVVLAACASSSPAPSGARAGGSSAGGTGQAGVPAEVAGRLQALSRAGQTPGIVMGVPSAGSMLANGMAVSSLKLGQASKASQGLTQMLAGAKTASVAVVGPSDALTAATIEAAIKDLKGRPTTTQVLFAGSRDHVEHLRQVAQQARVPFSGVVYP
ncbi:MAG: hypothetical protein GAK30_01765 [Paracidovorax wautersii]|uniref:Uncharacterized protein n=1 Tax=Paracidovorax wautersii TaxID=1177982 RepID=A0A7V8FP94_9BURK|nr:MAG: hypothetical protein GAK30_01765 [Paracidovorax wautersii]